MSQIKCACGNDILMKWDMPNKLLICEHCKKELVLTDEESKFITGRLSTFLRGSDYK